MTRATFACRYASLLLDGARNASYAQPECEYDAVDLSDIKIRLGE